jgi:ATP-binding protein involved in chromosome partitioning
VVVSTPSDVSLQDARKAIEMFRQMKVDLVGVVENMSYFVCPHCSHEIDIFSRGGAENMAKHFGVSVSWGVSPLIPEVRKSGDGGTPSGAGGGEFAACQVDLRVRAEGGWRGWERSRRASRPA